MLTESQLKTTYAQWTEAVQTAQGNPEPVLALYWPEATLLPTFSPKQLTTPEGLANYFVSFTDQAFVEIQTESFHAHCDADWGTANGFYTFVVQDGDTTRSIRARFTFVYRQKDNEIRILHHHSSVCPA